MVSGSTDADDVETMNVRIEDTTVTANRGTLIFLKSGAGTYNATVTTAGTLDSGRYDDGGRAHIGRGIELLVPIPITTPSQGITGDATNTKLLVDNVTIRNVGVDGIHVGMNEIASPVRRSTCRSPTASIGSADRPRRPLGHPVRGIEIISHDPR